MLSNCKIIIQARTQSTRLPNKVLLPFFQDKTILDLQISRLLSRFKLEDIIIATSENSADENIIDFAKENGIKWFAGEEDNVLKRFIDCATTYKVDNAIRVCSDNVFIDIEKLYQLYNIDIRIKESNDYIGFSVNKTPGIKTHYGFWGEWVKIDTLKQVSKITSDPLFTEHVTNFIYSNRDLFSSYFVDLDFSNLPKIRLTTDTIEDFNMQQSIYEDLVKNYGNDFKTKDVFDYLEQNPIFLSKMEQQIKLNEK